MKELHARYEFEKDRVRIRVASRWVEFYWITFSRKRKCWGIFANTILVYRTDGLDGQIYKWAFAVKVLGFGFGFAGIPDHVMSELARRRNQAGNICDPC